MVALGLVVMMCLAMGGPAMAQPASGSSSEMPSIPVVDNPAPDNASSAAPVEYSTVPGRAAGEPKIYYTFHTPFEFYLTLLIVGILAVTLAVLGFMARSSGFTPDFTRTFVIVVIVFAALFLISAGYSDQQAAPVYGLLGTIAGYIFGRMPQGEEKKDEAAPAPGANAEEKAI